LEEYENLRREGGFQRGHEGGWDAQFQENAQRNHDQRPRGYGSLDMDLQTPSDRP